MARLKSLTHFIILLIILGLLSFLVIYFSGNILIQTILVIILGLSYLLWGTIHHLKTNDLNLKIFIEYLLISFLGASTLIFIIIRV